MNMDIIGNPLEHLSYQNDSILFIYILKRGVCNLLEMLLCDDVKLHICEMSTIIGLFSVVPNMQHYELHWGIPENKNTPPYAWGCYVTTNTPSDAQGYVWCRHQKTSNTPSHKCKALGNKQFFISYIYIYI